MGFDRRGGGNRRGTNRERLSKQGQQRIDREHNKGKLRRKEREDTRETAPLRRTKAKTASTQTSDLKGHARQKVVRV